MNKEERTMGARAGTGMPTPQTPQETEKPKSEGHNGGQSAQPFHSASPPTFLPTPCPGLDRVAEGGDLPCSAQPVCPASPELGLTGRVTQGPPVTHLSEWTASSQRVGRISHDWFPLLQGRGWWEPKGLLSDNQGDEKVPHAMRASSYYSSV